MTKTKILFFGSPDLAVPSLAKLHHDENFEVLAAICPPAKPFGRKKALKKSPVQVFADQNNIPVQHATRKNDLLPIYEKYNPDLALVIAFGVIFPPEVLDFPRYKTLNVHFSLLPAYRGASPVQSALLNHEKVSGITIQVMKKALDVGDIVWAKDFEITNKTTGELFAFFGTETAKNLPKVLQNWIANEESTPQNEKLATYCHKFTKSDGEVDLKAEKSEDIYQKFLAFTPWPGIWTKTAKGMLKLKDVSLSEKNGGLKMQTADGFIWVLQLQPSGKRAMSAGDFARGNQALARRLAGESAA